MKKRVFKNWNYLLKEFAENYKKYPPLILKKKYKLDNATYGRLCNKFPNLKKISKNFEKTLNDESAFKYVKYLVENICKFQVDDKLPRLFRRSHFEGQYYSIYSYALKRTKQLKDWKDTSSVGFLICNTFPNKFLKSQFPPYKKINLFNSKKDIFNAMIEMFKLENEIDLRNTNLDKEVLSSMILDKHGTFNDTNLKKYGITRSYWSKIFKTKFTRDLRTELTEFLGLIKNQSRENLKQLLKKVENKVCAICGEKRAVQIHHIINVQDSHILNSNDDINDKRNLIPLCIYHHMDAGKIKLNNFYKKNSFLNLKKELLKKFRSQSF